jgi:hypothetical protein
VSSAEFTTALEWGGRPVARSIADALPRARIVVRGEIVEVGRDTLGTTPTYRCRLDDGSGQVILLFVGRTSIPGLLTGTRCTVEGTARAEGPLLVVWNPLYRIDEPARRDPEPQLTSPE